MIVERVVYNNGKNEGYFVKKRLGYVQVIIKEGIGLDLKNITRKNEINISDVNLSVNDLRI